MLCLAADKSVSRATLVAMMSQVRTLLILIFVVRFAMVAVEMIIPYLQLRLANRRAENKLRGQVNERNSRVLPSLRLDD